MPKSFKALSALLSYPTAELQEAAGEIAEAIGAEGLLPPALGAALEPLLAEIAEGDIYEVQERFVRPF